MPIASATPRLARRQNLSIQPTSLSGPNQSAPSFSARKGEGLPALTDAVTGAPNQKRRQMELQNWINEARAHWKEFLPNRYREFKEAGILEAQLKDAADRTAFEMG